MNRAAFFLSAFLTVLFGVSSAANAQIDLGRYLIRQNGTEVGRLIVVPGYAGQKIEYYFLYAKKSGNLLPFTPPSQSNPQSHMQFEYEDKSPGAEFDPFMYQFLLPVANQLIEATCVDFGTVGN